MQPNTNIPIHKEEERSSLTIEDLMKQSDEELVASLKKAPSSQLREWGKDKKLMERVNAIFAVLDAAKKSV